MGRAKRLILFPNKFMQEAISIALANPKEVPVGAVIVDKKNNIISKASNNTKAAQDPTAHAEILAIREACKFFQNDKLYDCSIYITVEPCMMCATAISYSRLRKVYFGVADTKFGAIESNIKIFTSSLSIYTPEIYGGILEAECKEILQRYFLMKRS